MKTSLIATIAVFGLALSGCGGGGGSSSAAAPEQSAAEVPTQPPVDPQPEPTDPAPVSATSELTAANEFTLDSYLEVPVEIDITAINNASGYLSICSALNEGSDDAGPDYDNCFIRTALPNSTYENSLDLSTAEGVAYSAIWFLDQTNSPVINRHDLSDGSIRLVL